MNRYLFKIESFKIWIVILWILFTLAMVIWWWILILNELSHNSGQDSIARHRMMLWEGGVFVSLIAVGGGSLIYFIYKDYVKEQKIKNFFQSFSHDLRTSISRLRLQTDVLRENGSKFRDHRLIDLASDIHRLDLQLENSLYLSQGDSGKFALENVRLSEVIQVLRPEYEELEIKLSRDAFFVVDRRAMISVIRNIFENSIRHGRATSIEMNVVFQNKNFLRLELVDNGRGVDFDVKSLGKHPVRSENLNSSGLGLFLIKQLIEKLSGRIAFENLNTGLKVEIILPGAFEKIPLSRGLQ